MRQFVQTLRRWSTKSFILFPALAIGAVAVGFTGVQAVSNSNNRNVSDCRGICVALTPEGMEPHELAVKVGEFVQFNSADGKQHNISPGEGSGDSHEHEPHNATHKHSGNYTSGDFGADEAWRVQFNQPGTYQLHDHYNPKLNILIVVYESMGEEPS